MIDIQSLLIWRNYAPWVDPSQIEQDLIISRALVEIYNHPLLKKEVAFRGGTALQKCFFENPTRYSEDIDLVQLTKGPIGAISKAIHDTLNPWLGKPNVERWSKRLTFSYRFVSTEKNQRERLKIEINTAENNNFLELIDKPFAMESDWYTGQTVIKTYQIDEIMGTKLRALYQRKKGRDLFDLARAIEALPINIETILLCLDHYLEQDGRKKISRAEFEKNLFLKRDESIFMEDIITLLPVDYPHDFKRDFDLVMSKIITKLPGEPWKGAKK